MALALGASSPGNLTGAESAYSTLWTALVGDGVRRKMNGRRRMYLLSARQGS
jgi:hypothetical protein